MRKLRIAGIMLIPLSFLIDFLGTAQAFNSYHIAALLSLVCLLHDTYELRNSPETKKGTKSYDL
jgi:hypothetical protein